MQHTSTVGSVPLGRYNGLPLRLHVSFLLAGIFVFFFRLQAGGDPAGNTGFILLIWLAAVLLHEAGHCFMVHRIGGNNEMLVLTLRHRSHLKVVVNGWGKLSKATK